MRLKFAVGLVLAWSLGVSAAEAADRWLRAESTNFVIYTDAERDTAVRYARQLETFDRVLRLRHGLTAEEPVRRKLPVYVLRGRGDLRRIRPGMRSDVQGFYASSGDDTFAVAIADKAGNDPTLQHEYVHHFMLQQYPFGYPAWLIEGYAEYFMTFNETPKYLEVGNYNKNRASWLSHARWLPMAQVLTKRPSELRTQEETAMFYAQSWALTHWFLSDPTRAKQLIAYVRAVGDEGREPTAALRETTGLTPAALERVLAKYLARGFPYQRFSLPPAPEANLKVTELPASADDLLLLSLRIKGDNGIDAPSDRTDGPVLLGDARKAAALHPGDAFAELVLARAEVKLGDLQKAEVLLQRRLAADPANVEALQLLGMARLRAASTAVGAQAAKLKAEAAAFAGRAYKLDPDNYQTLIVAARAREGSPSYPTENDVNVLLDVLDLAPQVHGARMSAAAALAHRGRKAEAANVLRSLAFDPHGGEPAAAARALLTQLEAGGPARASVQAAAP